MVACCRIERGVRGCDCSHVIPSISVSLPPSTDRIDAALDVVAKDSTLLNILKALGQCTGRSRAAASTREQLVKLVVTVAPDQECPLEGPPRHRPNMGRLDVRHDPMAVCFLGFPPRDEL